MEQLGTMYGGEWSCLSKMYTTTEESDFMAQLMGGFNSSVPYKGVLGTDDMISKLRYDDVVIPDECLDQSMADFHDNAEADCGSDLSLSVVSDHKTPDIKMLDSFMESKNPGKKSRKAADVKIKRNVKPKTNLKAESSSEQSSSLTYSENDNNACQVGESSSSHKVKSALNLNGKTRAGRGSATDPQSLYARKRRERINERLKTLQGLVPNGTKVDISTMLEEAVEYVKFLQLQIKLLSSDDLWMYAPLAYSGMDIGLFDSKNISNIPKYA